MKITASRLSEGNKVFPAEIHTDTNGIAVKIPGMFGGKTTNVNYSNISSVSVETPMVGYSTISIYTNGMGVITAHGFTKAEVNQIKQIIDEGKNGSSNGNALSAEQLEEHAENEFQRKKKLAELSTKTEAVWMKELELEEKEDAKWREEKQYTDPDKIPLLKLGETVNEISDQGYKLLALANSAVDSSSLDLNKLYPAYINKLNEATRKLGRLASSDPLATEEKTHFEKEVSKLESKFNKLSQKKKIKRYIKLGIWGIIGLYILIKVIF